MEVEEAEEVLVVDQEEPVETGRRYRYPAEEVVGDVCCYSVGGWQLIVP